MSNEQNNDRARQSAFGGFWYELRRRKVVRVASVYIITGWLIIQVASTTFASFGIPEWAFRFVTLMVLLGFPVALIIAWAFELTPDGIKPSGSLPTASDAADTSSELTRKRNWHAYTLGALLPTLIFGSLAAFFYLQAPNREAEPDAGSAPAQVETQQADSESIAVMPLVNMSSHVDNVHFAGGIHEDVLTNLSRIEDFQVISRTSMLRYAASELTLKEIGQQLGVDYIVEGSVRRIGNHVRVTIQLINAHNDMHLWANNFERELVDVFATQSELAREISDSVLLELQPESVGILEGMPTTSVRAYDLYIKAASLEKTQGETQESVLRQREMLEEAVAEDPDFVEAWAVLKRLYDLQLDRLRRRGWYISEGEDKEAAGRELSARSERALQKAVALDPDNEETLLAMAVDHDWPKTAEEMQQEKAIFDQVIAAYPESAKAWYHLGHWHSHLVDLPEHDRDAAWADARAAFDKALELDPFNARMVAAVLRWNRDKGFEDSLPRLAERLNQILPETAADRSLARVSWGFRRRQIESAFLATADESFIEEYQRGLADAVASGDIPHDAFRMWDEMEIAILTNDENRIIELGREPLKLDQSDWGILISNSMKSAAMHVYLHRGDVNQARLLAREILEDEQFVLTQNTSDSYNHIYSLAKAHKVLGNEDEHKNLIETALQLMRPEQLVEGPQLRLLAELDLERAIDISLAAKARNPSWEGFDWMAAYYLWERPSLTHPRVQEYYVAEDKWIDYLAQRVPEYAKYRQ